ncbi:uncharacterized protein EI97DRAFT_482656 [Westerdykella ornata]|uniref:Fungal N-terminal domain-containing protein n=1 Tax=Westerdykella ornata TaxID=318751 RepID=A0A6A6J9J8_WESOR|nr:uncharacterized protein EI97DRAFT_482656 [Westerdykella ornata]KAF2273062.1 hypothetical protein EI97DRAFT_482656 [Westerdykella ornata]
MVAPAFGFSVGDFIAGTKLLVNVFSAFKETGGASAKYASEVAFLNSLTSTLQHLEKQIGASSAQDDISRDLSKLAQLIREPLEVFKVFLDKYEASLGESSTRSSLSKAPKTIKYTVKELSGKVDKLRRQVEQPLQAVNSLLSLQVIKSIERLPDQPLQPFQCAQILEAIRVADIPAELDKQIQVLQRNARAHNIMQDEQLQRVEELRTKLHSEVSSLQARLKDLEQATAELATQNGQKDQLDVSKQATTSVEKLSIALETKSEKLEEELKEQRKLVIALRSFLEDKVEMQQIALATDDEMNYHNGSAKATKSWPSATLPAANLAILLLSSVVSSVAATTLTVAARSQKKHLLTAASRSTTTARVPVSTSSNNYWPTNSSIVERNPQAVSSQSSTWVVDFAHSSFSAVTKRPRPAKRESKLSYAGMRFIEDSGGNRGMSKLGEPEQADAPGHHHDNN